MPESFTDRRGAWVGLVACLILAACGGGDDQTRLLNLSDYTFYGPGATVAEPSVSGEIPSSGVFRMLPDGAETFDTMMRCVPGRATGADSGDSSPRSTAVGVLSHKASIIPNAGALVVESAGRTFFYLENCAYLSESGEPLSPPVGSSAISMVVDDKGSHILNGPSNTPSEVDAVMSASGMVVSEGPTIHWFAYSVGRTVVIVNTTKHSETAALAKNRVGVWIAQ